MDNPIVTITPSPLRRTLSIAILMLLGAVLIYLAFVAPLASVARQIFLIALGIGALILGDKMRRATALSIIMTEDAIIDSSGTVLCRLDDIESIDRGLFAFKPAQGFLLRTKAPLGRHWSPGLWWRVGRRIGVGGATPATQGKFMAEAVAMYISERGVAG